MSLEPPTTPRLHLRRVIDDDLPALVALNGDANVMHHIAPPMSPEQTRDWVAKLRADYELGPQGWFAVVERASGELVGLAALKKLSPVNIEALGERVAGCATSELVEVGWRFHERFWGLGYATESGRALRGWGFEALALPRIVAVALAANTASCRAIRKCGLRPTADYNFKDKPARMFVITRAEYEAETDGRED
jgi:RimJ/RimL family protein N-acetyltransferase